MSEVGDWTCQVCAQYSRHAPQCQQPDGRCVRCKRPIDEHVGVDTKGMKCP